jgi:hypothetical protein
LSFHQADELTDYPIPNSDICAANEVQLLVPKLNAIPAADWVAGIETPLLTLYAQQQQQHTLILQIMTALEGGGYGQIALRILKSVLSSKGSSASLGVQNKAAVLIRRHEATCKDAQTKFVTLWPQFEKVSNAIVAASTGGSTGAAPAVDPLAKYEELVIDVPEPILSMSLCVPYSIESAFSYRLAFLL